MIKLLKTIQTRTLDNFSGYYNAKRNINLDILKGIAIFCVILGHFIQYGMMGGMNLEGINFLDNPLGAFIYSFHMPLFMMISGYLMYQSIKKRTIIQQWLHWGKTLIIPLIAWTVIANIFSIIGCYIITGSLTDFHPGLMQYWFIFALLACGVTATLVKGIFKDKLIIYLLICVVLLLTTFNVFNIGWMFVFFVGGYILNKYAKTIQPYLPHMILGCLVVFPFLLLYYNAESFSYSSLIGLTDIVKGNIFHLSLNEWQSYILNDLYKIVLGFAGCGFVYCLVKTLSKAKLPGLSAILAWIGTQSLVIYFAQRIIFVLLDDWFISATGFLVIDLVLTLIISIIVTLIFAYFGTWLRKYRAINLILGGGR